MTFHLLVNNYRCLHKTGRCLPFTPGKSCQVVGVCMRLHNKCNEIGLSLPGVDDDAAESHDNAVVHQDNMSV